MDNTKVLLDRGATYPSYRSLLKVLGYDNTLMLDYSEIKNGMIFKPDRECFHPETGKKLFVSKVTNNLGMEFMFIVEQNACKNFILNEIKFTIEINSFGCGLYSMKFESLNEKLIKTFLEKNPFQTYDYTIIFDGTAELKNHIIKTIYKVAKELKK